MSGIERGLMSLAIPASDGDGYFTVTGHLEQSLAYLLIATLLAVTLVNYTGPDWSIGIRAASRCAYRQMVAICAAQSERRNPASGCCGLEAVCGIRRTAHHGA